MRPTPTSLRSASLLLTATSLLGGAAFLTGCEDAQARERQQASETIAAQSRALESATLSGDASKLQAVVSALGSVKGTDGQQAAASMLASGANRQLAGLALADAARLERQAGDLHALIIAQVDAAVELGQVLEGLASIDPAEQTRSLDQQRSEADASLRAHSGEMADLDQPINELSAARRDGMQRAEQLRQRANDLLRQASQMSYSEGFGSYQEAVETRRQADQIEYQVVLTELQLNYDYEAKHSIADAQARNAQALITSIDQSKRDLSTMHGELRQQVQASGRKFDELVTSINSGLQALQAMRSGEIAQAYESAVTNAETAATKAKSAAGKIRGEADAAKVAHARAAEAKGRAYAQQLHGLQQQANLLQRMADASGALGVNVSSALDAANAQMQQVKQMALDAFTEARDAAQGISGRDSQDAIQAFVAGLDRTIASLGGQTMQSPGSGDPAAGG